MDLSVVMIGRLEWLGTLVFRVSKICWSVTYGGTLWILILSISSLLLSVFRSLIKTGQVGASSICLKAKQQAQSKINIFTNSIIYKISITKNIKKNTKTSALIVYSSKQCGLVEYVSINHSSHFH